MQQAAPKPAKKRSLPKKKESSHWIKDALILAGASLPKIRRNVSGIKEGFRERHNDISRQRLSYKVSSRLIKNCSLKAGILGGITSAPGILPGFGTAGLLAVGLATDLIYLLRIQMELCYGIASAYEVPVDDEELQAITLALIGFSGTAEAAKGLGSSILRNSIDRTAKYYLAEGVTKAAVIVGRKQGLKSGTRIAKLFPFLGIPLGASLNIASTMLVGNHARKYFSTWVGDL